MERQARPEDDRRRERERHPLPAGELERGQHERHQWGGEERSRDEAHGPGRRFVAQTRRRSGAVPDRRDRADQIVELDEGGVEAHAGRLRREVDRCVDAVELVELPLDT